MYFKVYYTVIQSASFIFYFSSLSLSFEEVHNNIQPLLLPSQIKIKLEVPWIIFESHFLLVILPLLRKLKWEQICRNYVKNMKICKPELKQSNVIVIVLKIISKMKTLHCVQINENAALMLSNKIYVIATWSELLIDKFWLL